MSDRELRLYEANNLADIFKTSIYPILKTVLNKRENTRGFYMFIPNENDSIEGIRIESCASEDISSRIVITISNGKEGISFIVIIGVNDITISCSYHIGNYEDLKNLVSSLAEKLDNFDGEIKNKYLE